MVLKLPVWGSILIVFPDQKGPLGIQKDAFLNWEPANKVDFRSPAGLSLAHTSKTINKKTTEFKMYLEYSANGAENTTEYWWLW